MNKLNKIALGLLAILGIVLIPQVSLSSNAAPADLVSLSASNTINLNTEVDGESTSGVITKAKALCKKSRNKEHLYLFLNTPGGSIQAGLEMIEALNGLGCPVDTVTMFAASMGFQIAQNLGERLILKNGIMMSHRAAGEFRGSFGGTQPSQVDSRYQLWLDRVRELDEQTVRRTKGKQTYESYTKQYGNEMWLTGTKSVAQGYSDKIITARCDDSLTGATTHHASFMGMDILYDLDNCPLNTSPMNVRIGGRDGVLNIETVNEIKSKFLKQYENQQNRVVDSY